MSITAFRVSDADGTYHVDQPVTEADILEMAQHLAVKRFQGLEALTCPDLVRRYLRARMLPLEHEVFACIFLDNQHRTIAYEELFQGTIDGASVYPREVVKRALRLNAAACVLSHNHPSGVAEPSQADRRITERLKEALDLVGVRVLDHLVVGGEDIVSFAERGWL